jgi:hypothetical protein
MTRWVVLVLLALNLGLAAWNVGALSTWGIGPSLPIPLTFGDLR